MRTPTPLLAALAAAAGTSLLIASTPVAAQTQTTVDLSTCSSWQITNNVFACTPNGAPPPQGAPSNCTVSPSSVTLPTGGGAMPNLVASCAGQAATTWVWKTGAVALTPQANGATSTYQHPGNVTGSTTFSATPSNGGVQGTTINVAVTVTPATGGGGGNTGGGISCAPLSTVTLPLKAVPGTLSGDQSTQAWGSFGNDTIVVATFKTGSATTGSGSISFSEYGSGPVARTFALSTTPCDLSGPNALSGTRLGQGGSIYFQIGGTNSTRRPALQPNTVYYLNIKNEYQGAATCPGASCDIRTSVQIP